MDMTLGGAFIGGLLSFFSPCILPLVPPYLCLLAGLSLDQITGKEETDGAGMRVMAAAVAFVAGFTLVFVLMGASASYLGDHMRNALGWTVTIFGRDFSVLSSIAGLAIMIMGLHFLGVFKISLLYKQAQIDVEKKPAGVVGAFVMGLAFAFGWTPCVGPALATILMIAGTEDSAREGALLLGSYSLGIGIPFLVAAAFAGSFLGFMRRFAKHLGVVEKIMGGLLVVTGLLFITGSINEIGFWLQKVFPSLATVG